MKIKLLTLVACLFAFIATADAKVYYQGNVLRDIQVETVKGFGALYLFKMMIFGIRMQFI